MNLKNIMVAVDESDLAIKALDYAAALARAVGGRLAIVHAVDVRAAIVPEVGIASEEILKAMREGGRLVLERAVQHVGVGLVVSTMLVEGIVAEEITAASTKWGAGVLVVATHGRSGISRLVMGSTAESVMRHSKIPVFMVPAHAE